MTATVPPTTEFQPVDWDTIDNAIYDWLVDLLEVPVINEQQAIPQPQYPYASWLRASEVDEGGVDEKRQRTLDADDKVVGEDPTAGDPVINEEANYQPIQFTVTVQVHVDFTHGGSDSGRDAFWMCSKIRRSLGMTTVVDRFRVAGLSIIRPEALQDLSAEENGGWVSRAAVDVLFRTAAMMTERIGFYDKVQLKSDEFGIDVIVDAS